MLKAEKLPFESNCVEIMTPPSVSALLSKVYSATPRNVISASVTGGGITALQWMFTAPGASSSLMDSYIPYSRGSLTDMKNKASFAASLADKSVTQENAIQMAIISRRRAVEMLLKDTNDLSQCTGINVLGLSCTAKLRGKTSALGSHRFYVAIANKIGVMLYHATFEKDLRTREQEDMLCSHVMMKALSLSSNVSLIDNSEGNGKINSSFSQMPDIKNKNGFKENEHIHEESISYGFRDGGDALDNLYTGQSDQILFFLKKDNDSHSAEKAVDENGTSLEEFDFYEDINLPAGSLVYPGSFNPIHEGHIKLVQTALDFYKDDRPIVFEIAAINADKSALPRELLLSRVKKLLSSLELKNSGIKNVGVSVTRKPLFVQKAELFKGCTFIIGSDTMLRLLNPKYYANSNEIDDKEDKNMQSLLAMVAALSSMYERGNKFIVGGRKDITTNDFVCCDSIIQSEVCRDLPTNIKDMFHGLNQTQFRVDLSSSQLREKLEKDEEDYN